MIDRSRLGLAVGPPSPPDLNGRRYQLAEKILNRLPSGVIVTNSSGRVLMLNRMAEQIVTAGDGLRLNEGRLAACKCSESAALSGHLAEAAGNAAARRHGGAVLISRPSGARPYAVLITPLDANAGFLRERQTPDVLVLISDLERGPDVLGRRLIDLFHLTPAEARLAVALVQDHRLEDIAAGGSVRMPTLRTQLRATLAKTGTHRQAELVRLLLSLPTVLPPR